MRDRLDEMLRSEADGFAHTLRPRSAGEVRARGDQRRRRVTAATALLTVAVLTGSGAAAYSLTRSPGSGPAPPALTTPTPAPGPTGRAPGATQSPRSSGAPARPAATEPGIAGVTSKGALVVLDPATGTTLRTLVPYGVLPEEISAAPDGRVYYAVARGCGTAIYSVPVTGGSSTKVATGAQPAVSPDGTRLAFVREPYAGGGQPAFSRCTPANTVSLVIRDLATGAETAYPRAPGLSAALVYPISHLSWSPGGTRLALSFGEVQDNSGWNLVIWDPATARYYMYARPVQAGQVPVEGANQGFYYREGVYLPNGDLLVNRVCCGGVPVRNTSSLIQEVSTSGVPVHQVAVGFTNRVHSSLDALGRWTLYLSGNALFVSKNGRAPSLLTSGLVAAAWVPPAGS
jgi:hypothetical protein